ncbi:MAG: electron transfer flavoprotein subunit alpha/FixB family protein [bacterium]|nr:electron transfer flavoprotein subunit alpha/FixB family protein [bacterium]
MSILILAEHDGQNLSEQVARVVTTATQIGKDITLFMGGKGCQAIAEKAACLKGVSKVLVSDHEALSHPLAEPFSSALKKVIEKGNYSHVLAPASTFGKNILPRLAACLDVSQISEIVEVVSGDTFVRPIYAGNALATVQSSDSLKVITVRATAFNAAEVQENAAPIEAFNVGELSTDLSTFKSVCESGGERPELTAARVVISGGRGFQSAENFKMLDTLADKLNAAIGASRAAVDAGFAPNDSQVGQTGKVVAPDLYIAIGISGAIQHLAGIKDSKVIVAINKDPDAPIFQVADYGLVGDLFDIVPELAEAI